MTDDDDDDDDDGGGGGGGGDDDDDKWGCLKFVYTAPKHTKPNQISLNRTMQSQTTACITKSCEISALLRYYMALCGNSLPMFWDNLSVPLLRVEKSKRENRAQLKLTDTIFFFETSSVV